MSGASAIAVDSLSFAYHKKKHALRNVTMQIPAGAKAALAGPNGSGKTTLFFCMCGLLKPAAGGIRILDTPVRYNSFNPAVSYLFQNPDDQLFSPSIHDDIAFGPLNMGLPNEEVDRRVAEALEAVGVTELKDKPPHNISGGEKRLVALATLIAMQPSVYLLDEPTSNLDARNRRRLISLINAIPQTMLISSHDLEFLLEVCGQCMLMDEGAVVAEGPIRAVFGNRELVEAHGLEKPHSLIPHIHRESAS